MVGVSSGSDYNFIYCMVVDDFILWYRKFNLRIMYLLFFFCVIGIEMILGFDF